MSTRTDLLREHLQRGRGSDRWFHKRNQDFETKLGFFRVQVVNKRWWIIDPQGQPVLSLGICHIAYKGERPLTVSADEDPTGHSPYKQAVDRRYGEDAEAWAMYQAKRLRRWGFNTVGCWSSPQLFHQGLAYTVMLGIARRVNPHAWLQGDFPDPFSEAFQRAAEEAVTQECSPRKADPLLLGYFTDNELDWNGWRRGTPLFDYYLTKPKDTPGKQALVAQLKERYDGNIAPFNTAWDVQLGSFEDLLTRDGIRPGPKADAQAMGTDRDAFLRLAAAQYFSTCERVIRAADPNHMILGVRFAGAADTAVVEECGKHVDIVSYNNYSYDVPAEQLQRVFEATWRPIMITEWSFKAMDSGLPNTKGAAIPVYTQSDRADGYERYVTQALSLPYVVGLHWFQYTDQPILGRAYDGENSNYGVVDTDDEPYFTLVERMRQVNARAMDIAKAAPPLLGA